MPNVIFRDYHHIYCGSTIVVLGSGYQNSLYTRVASTPIFFRFVDSLKHNSLCFWGSMVILIMSTLPFAYYHRTPRCESYDCTSEECYFFNH